MWTNALIAYGLLTFLGTGLLTAHWWFGRKERIERENAKSQKAKAASS